MSVNAPTDDGLCERCGDLNNGSTYYPFCSEACQDEAMQEGEDEEIAELFRNAGGHINCSLCGKFVGKDGNPDPHPGPEGWEPVCAKCLARLASPVTA